MKYFISEAEAHYEKAAIWDQIRWEIIHSLVPAARRWMCLIFLNFSTQHLIHIFRQNSHWNRGWKDITVYWLLLQVTVNLKGTQTDGYFVEQMLHYDIHDLFKIVINLHPNYEDEEKNCISCCWRHCQRNISSGLFWFLWSQTLISCITVSFKCATLNIFTLCRAWQWCTIR